MLAWCQFRLRRLVRYKGGKPLDLFDWSSAYWLWVIVVHVTIMHSFELDFRLLPTDDCGRIVEDVGFKIGSITLFLFHCNLRNTRLISNKANVIGGGTLLVTHHLLTLG